MSALRSCAPLRVGGQQAQRPMIFLDVDHVVNRFPSLGKLPRRDEEFDDLRETRAAGFPITYSIAMGRRLAALEGAVSCSTMDQQS